jgi:capsid portal protein
VGLGKAYRMASHHQSAILLKRNLLRASYKPSKWLSRADFSAWALDWLIFGNAYVEEVPNVLGEPMSLKKARRHGPARASRRGSSGSSSPAC